MPPWTIARRRRSSRCSTTLVRACSVAQAFPRRRRGATVPASWPSHPLASRTWTSAPSARVLSVADFGAKADNLTDNTVPFGKALAACYAGCEGPLATACGGEVQLRAYAPFAARSVRRAQIRQEETGPEIRPKNNAGVRASGDVPLQGQPHDPAGLCAGCPPPSLAPRATTGGNKDDSAHHRATRDRRWYPGWPRLLLRSSCGSGEVTL